MASPFRPLLQRAFDAAMRRGWVEPRTRRRVLHSSRTYKGAEAGRLTASWSRTPAPADAEILRGLRPLRARSREMGRNSPYMRRFLSLVRSNVVGPNGITFQSNVRNGKGEPRRGVNDAIERGFADWGMCPDTFGRLSWLEIQNLAISTVAEDGEILIELIRDTGNRYGCTIALLDPELLDVEHNADNRDGSYIRMGVQFNTSGRREGYWIREASRDGRHYSGTHLFGNKAYRWVAANQMIHAFVSDRVGQTRGVPWASAVMWRAHMLDGYEDAAVTAARVGASKMGFLKGGSTEYKGTDVDADGDPLIDAFEPGAIEHLPEDIDFEPFNPDYPHAQFDSFVKRMLQGVSAGFNVAHHALSNDLEGVNFSSIRAGVLEDRESWKALQAWFINSVVRPVFRFWLPLALARDGLNAGGKPLNINALQMYLDAAFFQGRRWAWVDPLKDMQAAELAYRLGAKSIGEIIRDMGRDPEEVWRERQRDSVVMGQYGVAVDLGDAMPADPPGDDPAAADPNATDEGDPNA